MSVAIVAGPLANKPDQGGAAWVPLSWALGLRRLGFEVWLLEEISASVCTDASGRPAELEHSQNLAFFRAATQQFGLRGALLLDGRPAYGATAAELHHLAGAAALLINISGHLSLPWLLERIALRVYLDLDPGFTQIWAAQGLEGIGLERHHAHYTIGENIGRAGCSIPTAGVSWRTTRNPVILDLWPAAPPPRARRPRFTTVASWRGPYGTLEVDGERHGLKAHEFRRVIDLPRQVSADCEVALDIDAADGADRQRLLDGGWTLADPRVVAGRPEDFAGYVRGSSAELSVAQEMYVKTHSGWFSDRTTRYLATGRPAVVQDTGFAENLPVGRGLLSFDGLAEAMDAVEQVCADYDRHAAVARAVAESCFDSDVVIGGMLAELDVAR